MLCAAKTSRAHSLVATLLFCSSWLLAPINAGAQTPSGPVPITAEPDHKIRFDNGRVRMYEVVLSKGKATLVHEHRADSFNVFPRTAEFTNEPQGGKPVVLQIPAGTVRFASTAKGPFSHRVIATGDMTFHVIAMELLTPPSSSVASATQRASPPFKVELENQRGRVHRISLSPGESTETFTRPTASALFATSTGRISENPDGRPMRLWDFEPGHFRWFDGTESVSLKNEGTTPIELVEIEVF